VKPPKAYAMAPLSGRVDREACAAPASFLKKIRSFQRCRQDLLGDFAKGLFFLKAFEHFICNEIRAYLSYSGKRTPLYYWRSKSKFEVDFVIGDLAAIEVKAAGRVSQRDHKGLEAISEENTWQHLVIVSQDKQVQTFDTGIRHQYWENFLKDLWAGKIV